MSVDLERFLDEPFDTYAQLHAHSPVYWDSTTKAWYVSGTEQVQEALKDPRLTTEAKDLAWTSALSENVRADVQQIESYFMRWPVFSEEPASRLLRAKVAPTISARRVQEQQARIRTVIEEVAAQLPHQQADLLHDFALPTAVRLCTEFLGGQGREDEWTSHSLALLKYISSVTLEQETVGEAMGAIRGLHDLVQTELLPAAGPESVLGTLKAALTEEQVEIEDVAAFVAQLATGIMGPLVSALCTAALSMKLRPLEDGREQTVRARIESCLATEPPFHFASRWAVESFSLFGKEIARGDHVFLVLASMESERSERPGCPVSQASSTTPRNLAFGLGMHYCIGAPLARMYLTVALDQLLAAGVIDRLQPEQVRRVRMIGMTRFAQLPLSAVPG